MKLHESFGVRIRGFALKGIRKWKEPLGPGKYNEFVKVFHRESDRAAGVIAGAFLGHFLRDILKSYLREHPIVDDLLDGATAPMSTFSARSKFCFALGLISKEALDDLEIIRKIRNHFAHHPMDTSFSNSEVKRLCSQLSNTKILGDLVSEDDSRSMYLLAIGMIVGRMSNAKLEQDERIKAARASNLPLQPTAAIKEIL